MIYLSITEKNAVHIQVMYFLFDSVFLKEVKRDGMIDRFRVTVRYTLQWDAALVF